MRYNYPHGSSQIKPPIQIRLNFYAQNFAVHLNKLIYIFGIVDTILRRALVFPMLLGLIKAENKPVE